MPALMPRQPVPNLKVPTLSGAHWKLGERKPENFTMVVFYRGLHCPICKTYLRDLDAKAADFAQRGVEVVVISSDSRERAEKTRQDWGLQNLDLGYGLPIPVARQWGLYVSKAIKDSEPAEFSEPGLFLVRPDGTLYCGSVNTMPFARPSFAEVMGAVDFVVKNNYPARGEA